MSRVESVSRRIGLDPRAFIGLSVIGVGLLLWVLAFTGTLSKTFSSPTRVVRAQFASAEDISPNDPVRISGVQVGSVASVKLDAGGRSATVTMNVDANQPIYRNASANILWRTLLGANDAISINAGTAASGALGDSVIPESHDSNQVELDQVTEAFKGGAASGIRTSLKQLGVAFSDHPAVAGDLSTLAQIAPAATTGIGAVRGEIKDTDLRNLIRNAGEAAQALSVGTNASETQQFVQSAGTTLTALGDNPSDLEQGIQQLDRVYVTGDADIFRQYTKLLTDVNPLVAKLNGSVGAVAPTLVDLKPTLRNTSKLLTAAEPLLHNLDPAVNSIAGAAEAGVPVINNLQPGLKNLDDSILPGLKAKSPEEGGRSAYEEIGPVLDSLAGITSYFNEDGQLIDLTAGATATDVNSFQLLPCSVDFSGSDLLVCQSLSASLDDLFSLGGGLVNGLTGLKTGAGSSAQKLESAMKSVQGALTKSAPQVAKVLYGGTR